jgi:7-cyano-7-deazaguanine synthase
VTVLAPNRTPEPAPAHPAALPIRPPAGPLEPSFRPADRNRGRDRPRALVLFSGGVDSTVALWWAQAEGFDTAALTFQYPGRPRGEENAARVLLRAAGNPRRIVLDLPFLRESDSPAHPPGYVPARNPLFYAIAFHVAASEGIEAIVGGHNAEDGERFPDAHRAFLDELGRVLAGGLARGVARGTGPRDAPYLTFPLVALSKREVVARGKRLGAPVEQAWSCYEDLDEPCGQCPACKSLPAAFA